MKKIINILLFLFAILIFNHPNTKALIKGISSVAIDAPIAKAKSDLRKEAENQIRRENEAREREIDAALNKIDQNKQP